MIDVFLIVMVEVRVLNENINIVTSAGHFGHNRKIPTRKLQFISAVPNDFPFTLLFIYNFFFILISLSNEPKLNYSPL